MTTTETDAPVLELVTDLPAVPDVSAATAAERERIAGHPAAFRVRFGSLRIADNIRDDDFTDVDKLAADIRRRGLLQPIAVRPYGYDDETGTPVFVVEAGHRRYNALRALKLDADDLVPVHPVTETGGVERTVRQFVENVQRKPLTPIDEANALRTLQQMYGQRLREAAATLGIDRNTASRRMLLLRLPPATQQAVAAGQYEIEAAQLVGRLIRDKAPAQLVDQLINERATRTRTQAAVDEWAEHREFERVKANLEAVGFVVVTNPKNGPADDGYRTEVGRYLAAGTVADAKQLDRSTVETVSDDDDRPVVWLTRSGTERQLQIYSLRHRQLPQPAPETGDSDDGDEERPLTFAENEAARAAMKQQRYAELRQWFISAALNGIEYKRAAVAVIVSRSHNVDIEWLAETIDADLVRRSGTALDLEATADAWFADLSDEQIEYAFVLLPLMVGITHLGYADGGRSDVSALAKFTAETTGVPAALTADEYRPLAVNAGNQNGDDR